MTLLKDDWEAGDVFTASDANAVAARVNACAANVRDYGSVGDGSTHAVSTLIGTTFATLADLRENRWSGCRFADDDDVVIFDPLSAISTLYLKAGDEWAHITYNTSTGAITLDSDSGGITVGSGVLTGTSGSDGAITISGTASVIYVENRSGERISVIWSEAETTTELDWLGIQHAMALATYQADISGGTAEVTIPAGTYICDRRLFTYSNTKVVNNGHLKFTGGNFQGGFLWIQAAQNVEIAGGIWDSNEQANDNTIGITHVGGTGLTTLGQTENVWVHHLTVIQARHGGAHIVDVADPSHVGGGGGKGITVQFGARNVLISDVLVDDCDLGVSIEGKESLSGYTPDIVFQNVIVKDCRYMGLYLTSNLNTPSLYGTTSSLSLSNIEFVDCGVGQTLEGSPQDIADLFGVITLQTSTAVKATGIRIRSTTGKMTAFRGAMRFSDWDVQVICAGELVDVVNSEPYDGYGPQNSPSRYNQLRAHVFIAGATFSGSLVNSNVTYAAEYSRYDFTVMHHANGSPTSVALAQYAAALPATSILQVCDLYTGRYTLVNNGSDSEAASSIGAMFLNGLVIKDDSGSNLTKIGPTRTTLALASPNGTSQLKLTDTRAITANGLGFNTTNTGLLFGTGSPEGAVTAGTGSVYFNTSGGASSSFVKASGTGNTGWVENVTLSGTQTLTNKTLTSPAVGTSLTLNDAANIIANTTTGSKIGTATGQKLGFWNASPVVQPTTGVAEAAFTENPGGTAINVDSTFGGYTLQQVVQALQSIGLLA